MGVVAQLVTPVFRMQGVVEKGPEFKAILGYIGSWVPAWDI